MSFRTRRVLMSSPFYALISYLVLNYISSLLEVKATLYILLFVLFMWSIHVVPMFFEKEKSSMLGRCLTRLFGVWEWVLVMLIIYSAILFILGFLIKIPKTLIICLLLTIPVIGAYSYYNAHKIVIKERVLEFDNLGKDYNIVHLSDVHFGSIMHKKSISNLARKLDALSDTCDLAIISGDLADGSCAVEEDDLLALGNVDMPIIFTSGNHDYYQTIESVHAACRKAGIIVLENSGMIFDDLNIYGLSYSLGDIEMPGRDELLSFIDDDKVNIVNYHIPNGWDELSQLGFDIQLSGHTHGGQFYPVIFFGNLFYEGHNMGLFRDDLNHYLHVTTGVGCMDFPMRWGTDSELVVLKLRGKR